MRFHHNQGDGHNTLGAGLQLAGPLAQGMLDPAEFLTTYYFSFLI